MTSKVAKGTAYEKFTQSLYQTLFDAEGSGNVVVEHNKKDLVGNSGCAHQIDVYWEFTTAGVTYRTAIECKAFAKPVPIGKVRDFYGVLADVPNLKGLFVSMFGFQSGAKKFATHYGIDLKEIREPEESDWEGRVKDIHINLMSFNPDYGSLRPNVTAAFMSSLPIGGNVDLSFQGMTDEPVIFDDAGNPVASIIQIFNEITIERLIEYVNQEEGDLEDYDPTSLEFSVPYPNHTWLSSTGEPVPIDSVTLRYSFVDEEKAVILGESVAKAIMKDVESGEFSFFHKNGEIHKPLR